MLKRIPTRELQSSCYRYLVVFLCLFIIIRRISSELVIDLTGKEMDSVCVVCSYVCVCVRMNGRAVFFFFSHFLLPLEDYLS